MTHPSPAPRRDAAEQARFEAELRELFEHRISFNELLGFRILSFEPARPRVRIEMRPALVGHFSFGRLHGGVIASVLDATAGLALMLAISEKHADESAAEVIHRFSRMGTIDLRIDYLRQGIGAWFEGGARVTRLGGRIGSVQMDLHAEGGALVATGAASFVIS